MSSFQVPFDPQKKEMWKSLPLEVKSEKLMWNMVKKPKGQMYVNQNNTKTYEISRVETFASNLAQLLLASVSVRFGSIV